MIPSDQTIDVTLFDFLSLNKNRYIYIFGGGGKTTLMSRCALLLSQRGFRTITTTSTKILYPQNQERESIIIHPDLQTVITRSKLAFKKYKHLTIAKGHFDNQNKLIGFAPEELDLLWKEKIADYLIVEGDGAAGRPLKVHADHEPVLSNHADVFCAVFGIETIGKPFNSQYVHRFELARTRLQKEPMSPISLSDVTRLFFHSKGTCNRVPTRDKLNVFINKCDKYEDRQLALKLSRTLRKEDHNHQINKIAMGCFLSPAWVEEIPG